MVAGALLALALLLAGTAAVLVLVRLVPGLTADDDVTPTAVVAVVAAPLSLLVAVAGVAVGLASRARLLPGDVPARGASAGDLPTRDLRRAVRRGDVVGASDVARARAAATSMVRGRTAAFPLAALPLAGLAVTAAAWGTLDVVLGAAAVVGGIAAVVALARDGARGQSFLDAHPQPGAVRAWLAGSQGEGAERDAAVAALRRRWLVALVLLVLVAPAVLVPLVPRGADALAPAPPPTWRAVTGATLGLVGAVLLVLGALAAWRGGQVDRWVRSPVWGLPPHRRRLLLLRLRGLDPTPAGALPAVQALAAHLAHQGATLVLLAGLATTLLGRGVGSPFSTTLVLSLVAVGTVLGLLVALVRARAQARRFLGSHREPAGAGADERAQAPASP